MKKAHLKDIMNKRTPLNQREIVAPANMYARGEMDKATRSHVVKTTRRHVEKYTTHLRPETIRAVKKMAFDTDRKDYQVVQAALDAYFEGSRKS